MNPTEVVKLSRDLQGKSAAVVEEELRRRHCDAETRIAIRIEMQAQSQERRIEAALATDSAEYSLTRQPANETQRLLVRAGFRLGQRYGAADVDRMLQEAGFDATQRIACRVELPELAMTAAADQRPMLHASHGRTIEASVERQPTFLVDESGQPRTLRGYSW